MTYDEFRSLLKTKDFTPLYLFTGEEDFLASHSLIDAKKAIVDPAFEDFNYKYYIEAPSYEDAHSFITALPLMSDKKLIVFNNCNLFARSLSEQKKWETLFSSLPSYVVVIVREKESEGKKGTVVEQAVKNMGVTVNFTYLPEDRLRSWIVKAAAKSGKSMDVKDASYLLANLGQSMTLLKSEIEKICAKAEDFVITRKDIDSVISNRLEENVFKLIDAVFASRCDVAYTVLANLDSSEADPFNIISLLSSQTLSIYKAKLMLSERVNIFEVKKAISRNPYAADKLVQKAQKVSLQKLEKLIGALTDIEYKIKNGLMDPRVALDMIIAL